MIACYEVSDVEWMMFRSGVELNGRWHVVIEERSKMFSKYLQTSDIGRWNSSFVPT